MILFSDLHLRAESEAVIFGEVLPGILEACVKHDDYHVGFLGDLWHLRYTVDVRLQNALRDTLLKWGTRGVRVWLLVGNHDQVDLNGRNALEVFADMPHVKVFSQPEWNEYGLWVPYRAFPQDVAGALALPRPTGAKSVVFIHHGIRGAMMNNLMADSEGLPLAMFDSFDTVLSGHYHKRQQVGRVWYIGSPWQTKADEIGQSKGYALWDGKRLTYVDTSWGPKHYKFIVDDPAMPLDLSMVRKCDRVRVEITHPQVDREKIAAQLAKVGVLPVVEGAAAPEIKQRLGAAGSLEEYAGRYIEAFAAERQLEAAKLHDVFRRITA